MKHKTAFDMIYKSTLEMSRQELLAYLTVITDTIQTIKALNPLRLYEDEEVEFVDEMNRLLLDSFRIKKLVQDRLEAFIR